MEPGPVRLPPFPKIAWRASSLTAIATRPFSGGGGGGLGMVSCSGLRVGNKLRTSALSELGSTCSTDAWTLDGG